MNDMILVKELMGQRSQSLTKTRTEKEELVTSEMLLTYIQSSLFLSQNLRTPRKL